MLRNMRKDLKRNTVRGLFPAESKSEGFTLIESLLALFILSIGLLGMVALQYSIMGYNQYAKTVTTATTLAQSKIEDLKNMNYASIADETENSIDEDGNAGGIYTRETSVDSSLSNGKIITVKVSWSLKGKPRDVSIKTILKG